MADDTLEEPVESIEDAIASAFAEQEKDEEIEVEETEVDEPEESESEDEPEEEPDEDDSEPEEEPDDDQDDASEDVEEDKLEPPEHWSAIDKETFGEQPKAAQEWLLKRHKEMEGDYTRKRQQESSKVRLADSVTDALSPYRDEFARAGLDEAGAVRQLAHWHTALRTSPREAIQALANTYGVDLSAGAPESGPVDPALQSIQQQLGNVTKTLTEQQRAAQLREQEELYQRIQSFEEAKGEDGKLLHPHFETVKDDIAMLINNRTATGLEDGYALAIRMRGLPERQTVTKTTVKKDNPAEKVKAAKRAAAGVKSSGAVGKRDRAAMSLEEEIASHL